MSSNLLAIFLLALTIVTINGRSIADPSSDATLIDTDNNVDRMLTHAFTGYRYRFEKSNYFKQFSWALKNVKDDGLCDLCDIGVPFVRSDDSF